MPEVWGVDYEARAVEAAGWAGKHAIGEAGDGTHRVCLFAVDCQNTFCTPGSELFVPGAPATPGGCASSSTGTSDA